MDLGSFSLAIIAAMTVAGALLGGAVAHWRRGGGYIVTGAIIGGAAGFIAGLLGIVFSFAGTVAVLSLVVLGFLWLLFG